MSQLLGEPFRPSHYVLLSPFTLFSADAFRQAGMTPRMQALIERFTASHPELSFDLKECLGSGPEFLSMRIFFGGNRRSDRLQAERLQRLPTG